MSALSVACSVAGLLTTGLELAKVLAPYILALKETPRIATHVLSEIRATNVILSGLQKLFTKLSDISPKSAALIELEELVVILTDGVLIYSELESAVGPLIASDSPDSRPALLARLQWTRKESLLEAILMRLQGFKGSITLVLAILQTDSQIQAEEHHDRLSRNINTLLENDEDLWRRVGGIGITPEENKTSTTQDDQNTQAENKIANATVDFEVIPSYAAPRGPPHPFELDLEASRVYRMAKRDTMDFSFRSSLAGSIAWSIFSGLSISDISAVAAIALPIKPKDLSNAHRYEFSNSPWNPEMTGYHLGSCSGTITEEDLDIERSKTIIGTITPLLRPCASSESMFFYTQGSAIMRVRHNTLAMDTQLQHHNNDIILIEVDNSSRRESGKYVFTYDMGGVAVVWNLATGKEVSRFVSPQLTCAAWMRNGHLVLGNAKGCLIFFDPITTQHFPVTTFSGIAISAIAQAEECEYIAIGCQTGAVFIVTPPPNFAILYHAARRPQFSFPVATLRWHRTPSLQQKTMLAVQYSNGDLRVWSMGKVYSPENPIKTVRVLDKKGTDEHANPHWMAWSKNGTIVQYSDSETLAWDVRTKYVTQYNIPLPEGIQSMAVYGPEARLFTIGPDDTIQQFNVRYPPTLVASVQHPLPFF
uniref:Fungal N-terminal domain-containing protein n=1 Tax=Bionectria ochroleuca TaxID=29856 RepID=A0A8H7N8F4_BIOOC